MRMIQRAAAITGLTTLALTAATTAASAHVTANPNTAVPGSYTKVSFRVPNEEPSADTTRLQIDLPMDHPIASVSVRPVPGWKIKVETKKLATPIKSDDAETTKAVSRITWSGGRIAPGEFEEFDVSLGPIPKGTDRLLFNTAQTYSDGTVVNWNQDPGTGAQEPEHPAPTLHLTADKPSPAPAAEKAPTDGTTRLLAALGLAAGILGALLGAVALMRSRS